MAIRSFVAVPLGEELHRELDRLLRRLQADAPPGAVKWVPAANIHLTLKFLGDIRPEQVEPILKALGTAVGELPPFSFVVEGFGCFPGVRRPRVLWAGVRETTGRLQVLQERVERALNPLGFPPEGRAFSPHLTLGRVREGVRPAELRGISQWIERTHVGELGVHTVTTVILFRSDLRPAGPIYTPLGEIPLAGRG
ncbi:MAG: RNA 2',3'-cyclic phosphodiesterase [Anaerolineae bacterium]